MLRKLPPRASRAERSLPVSVIHVQIETVRVERDKHVHLVLGDANALIRDVQFDSSRARLYEEGYSR